MFDNYNKKGGDTTTVGSIVGSLLGALYGSSWIPKKWFDNIENEDRGGRDWIIDISKKLLKVKIENKLI